jgi:D-alanyl-D-alanine carboxypeptidase/D-alanyl-D-alanine-endopeptidase (penicillin-binding protein 4)
MALIKGSIPLAENSFSISLADPDPTETLAKEFCGYLQSNGIVTSKAFRYQNISRKNQNPKMVHVHSSPPLDSVNYYFLRKSVNLYGEALLKTISLEKKGFADTEKGIELVRNYFSQIGIDKLSINIIDGSGLSPQNRVTANALLRILQLARSKPWYNSFFHALPEYNGMKMKSGAINGVRAYAGYHKATDGKEYAFSIIVNNFNGSGSEIVRKIYKLLNLLK